MNAVGSNIEKTKDIAFDAALPLLFITRPDSDRTSRGDGKTIEGFYKTYITNPVRQEVATFSAPHYMHWTRSAEIAEAVDSFLAKRSLE